MALGVKQDIAFECYLSILQILIADFAKFAGIGIFSCKRKGKMNVLQHQRLKKKNKKKKQKKDVKENAQKKTTKKKECFKLQWLMAATD